MNTKTMDIPIMDFQRNQKIQKEIAITNVLSGMERLKEFFPKNDKLEIMQFEIEKLLKE